MEKFTARSIAHPNIALIKYWGNRDDELNIPSNGSISMNLGSLETRTSIDFDTDLTTDLLTINAETVEGAALKRVSKLLELFRSLAKTNLCARVKSTNNFPSDAGLASSAAAFAALALAASHALGLNLAEADLSRLARRGSGSACRSIPAGFVEWLPGENEADSYAISIAPPDHWRLSDCIAIIRKKPKAITSAEGHLRARTSPIQNARVLDTTRRLDICRRAIQTRDFEALATIVEQDSTLMHAVMMTSSPPLYYWEPTSIEVMQAVMEWRTKGIPACFTLDAGANVHVLCPASYSGQVTNMLKSLPGVIEVLLSAPGGRAVLMDC
jgi:diphosphomevalonate decarboxylase